MTIRNKPHWIKAKLPGGPNYNHLKKVVRNLNLNTVCEEAKCPNIGECWGAGTLTFMILGDTCTRSCGFCHVKTGRGSELDWGEPDRVADAVYELKNNNAYISHLVITSVNRDDKNFESACIFSETVKKVKETNPGIKIEVLIPDFKGDARAIEKVIESRPDVLNHNIETVPRLYNLPQKTQSGKTRSVRPQAVYKRSLDLLKKCKDEGHIEMLTKSGIMIGLGETYDEILSTLSDLKNADCDIVTIGQYLQPTLDHIPVSKFYHPLEFESLKNYGEKIIGLPHIESGPLVRSSYHAEKQVLKLAGNF
ncbi:MAG: lipoyl synthase [Candidatus Dadabacteria bacterium]|nr:lipoyl synthase [Candidatus Dadabacteria bacterium]NIQ14529.1 lipoyl synthase [Candidatus Dadabacteria bacterium]